MTAAVTEYPTYWKGRDIEIRREGYIWYRAVLTRAPELSGKTVVLTAVLIDNCLSGDYGKGNELQTTTLAPFVYVGDDRLVGYFSALSNTIELKSSYYPSNGFTGTYGNRVSATIPIESTRSERDYTRNITDVAPDHGTTTGLRAGSISIPEYSVLSGESFSSIQDCTVSDATWNASDKCFYVKVITDTISTDSPTTGQFVITLPPIVGFCSSLGKITSDTPAEILYDRLTDLTYLYSSGSSGINSQKQISGATTPVAHLAKLGKLTTAPWLYQACTPYTRWLDKFVGFYSCYNRKSYEDEIRGADESEKEFKRRKDIRQHILNYGDGKNFSAFSYGALFNTTNSFSSLFADGWGGGKVLGYPIRPTTELAGGMGYDFEDEEFSYGVESVRFYGLRVPITSGDKTVQSRLIEVNIAKTFWENGMSMLFLTDDIATYDPNEPTVGYGYQTFDLEWEEPNGDKLNGLIDLCRSPNNDITVGGVTHYAYLVKNAYQTLETVNAGNGLFYYQNATRKNGARITRKLCGFGNWPNRSNAKLTASPQQAFDKLSDLVLCIIASCEGGRSSYWDKIPAGYNLGEWVNPGSFGVIDLPLSGFSLAYSSDLVLSDMLQSCLLATMTAVSGYHDITSDAEYGIKAFSLLTPRHTTYTVNDDDILALPSIITNNEVYTQYVAKYSGATFTGYDRNAMSSFGSGSELELDMSSLEEGTSLTDMTDNEIARYTSIFSQIFAQLHLELGYPRQEISFPVPLDKAALWNLGDGVTVTSKYLDNLTGTATVNGIITALSHSVTTGVTNVTIQRSVQSFLGWNSSFVFRLPLNWITAQFGYSSSISDLATLILGLTSINATFLGTNEYKAYNTAMNYNALMGTNIGDNGDGFFIITIDGYPIKFRGLGKYHAPVYPYTIDPSDPLFTMTITGITLLGNASTLPTNTENRDVTIRVFWYIPCDEDHFRTGLDTLSL
jgi:hypothetical protein